MARKRAVSDPPRAETLGRISIGTSIAGIIVAFVVVIVVIVLMIGVGGSEGAVAAPNSGKKYFSAKPSCEFWGFC